ncbi:hypothetical protein CSUI_003103 [Cystoisospora suis]|uniref:Transmembrane protein n=1 Tax=Cystoisospora suis TaxID=483139 RepID=A0A2C6L665_9APIC|nr:hypothetical protein CSUI_003103 [Cystoisospora suis]
MYLSICLSISLCVFTPGAGLPIGAAYFQVVHHNVEAEAARLHQEGNLHREKLRQERKNNTYHHAGDEN